MTLVLKIVAVVVVVLVAAIVALRVRKLHRDEMRELTRPVERRLMAPPPSPYQPSRGFRLLDSDGAPLTRAPLERPRLDPTRHYVFNETTSHSDEVVASSLRHKDDWFLNRSAHRSTLSIALRRLAVVVLIALIVVVVVTYYSSHHAKKHPSGALNEATTTLTTTTVTTTTFPSALRSTSVSGDDAAYRVPAAQYQVVVRGALGPSWTVYEMGPSNTLEWQGTVAQGHVEALTMIGNSRITIGSPSSASVHVNGSPVVFPSPLPSTLVLVFTSTTLKGTTSPG